MRGGLRSTTRGKARHDRSSGRPGAAAVSPGRNRGTAPGTRRSKPGATSPRQQTAGGPGRRREPTGCAAARGAPLRGPWWQCGSPRRGPTAPGDRSWWHQRCVERPACHDAGAPQLRRSRGRPLLGWRWRGQGGLRRRTCALPRHVRPAVRARGDRMCSLGSARPCPRRIGAEKRNALPRRSDHPAFPGSPARAAPAGSPQRPSTVGRRSRRGATVTLDRECARTRPHLRPTPSPHRLVAGGVERDGVRQPGLRPAVTAERPPIASPQIRGRSILWRRQDSNLGRLSRRIYSPLPLATRAHRLGYRRENRPRGGAPWQRRKQYLIPGGAPPPNSISHGVVAGG